VSVPDTLIKPDDSPALHILKEARIAAENLRRLADGGNPDRIEGFIRASEALLRMEIAYAEHMAPNEATPGTEEAPGVARTTGA
jgi:hypothetical protein